MLVQECQGSNSHKFVSANSTIRIVLPGKDPAQSPIALEVYEKPDRQKVKDTIDATLPVQAFFAPEGRL